MKRDFDKARELADEGMARSADSAGEEWAAKAEDAILKTARRLGTFTSQDVWEILEPPEGGSPSALGARFASLRRRGFIDVCPDKAEISAIPQQHMRLLRVWQACNRRL